MNVRFGFCSECQDYTGPPLKRKHRWAPVSGLNLVGDRCVHTYAPYKGLLMCSRPLCAALCNPDGSVLTQRQATRLLYLLRMEIPDFPTLR